METKYRMFLLAARELNFTRAAEKAFVTQQCMSNYIRKLEEEYGTPLFERSPRLSLTQTGAALYRHLVAVQNLEHGFALELDSIRAGANGFFRFGINSARARRLLAAVIPAYYERFPHVEIETHLNDTAPMCEELRSGALDLFLGVRTPADQSFSVENVCDDSYYFVVSRGTMKHFFPNDYEVRIRRFISDISLSEASEIPLVTNLNISTGIQMIETMLMRSGTTYDIRAHTVLQISDFETQFMICKRAPFIAICPGMVIDIVIDLNRNERDEDKRLYVFPSEALRRTAPVQLVRLKNRAVPHYLRAFEELLRAELLRTRERGLEYVAVQNRMLR